MSPQIQASVIDHLIATPKSDDAWASSLSPRLRALNSATILERKASIAPSTIRRAACCCDATGTGHLRNHHQAYYERTADEIEASLVEEVETGLAEDLGRNDTFRFEEARNLKAALGEQRWSVALEWAGLRIDGESFWLRDYRARQSAWQLIDDGGRLGAAIEAAGGSLGAKTGLEQAVQRYLERGAAVDQSPPPPRAAPHRFAVSAASGVRDDPGSP